jgi:hypothetical protein
MNKIANAARDLNGRPRIRGLSPLRQISFPELSAGPILTGYLLVDYRVIG